MIHALAIALLLLPAAPGDWPEPRQNPHLTAHQPLPGAMQSAPETEVIIDLGRSRPSLTQVTLANGQRAGLALVQGALYAYTPDGTLLWKSHPPGLNYANIKAIRDLNGDGTTEILMQAGRAAMPYGSAVIVSLETGELVWRYDVEPMSYAWYLYSANYIPDHAGEQIIVMMHAYPPDKDNGYITLFAYDDEASAPTQQWRYDFHEYTCFPSLLQSDLDGDGAKEIVIQTHSRMWFLDAVSGEMKHFAKWDVAPANIRSYGLVKFLDLDGDADEDFLCIANFAQHHEVLLNNDGKMEKAWHHGWPESVTTGKVVSTWPEPPHADIDGDGALEIVVSMFNSENENAWLTRVYDALSGELRYRYPGVIATAIHDVDNDGAAEILGSLSQDPTRSKLDGAILLGMREKTLQALWRDADSATVGTEFKVSKDGTAHTITLSDSGVALEPWNTPAAAASAPDFSATPAIVGPAVPEILAANLDDDAQLEPILHAGNTATRYDFADNRYTESQTYSSQAIPAIVDLTKDGVHEIITATVTTTATPSVTAHTNEEVHWQVTLPPPTREGLPQPRVAYMRTGDFTGDGTPDVYLWAGTPIVRSVVLDGRDGTLVWDRGEFPDISRYWGPSVNQAATYDFNGDGADDLVFTNPDYYCIADGKTGEMLLGPTHPPQIFDQPSQGLYTLPAILDRPASPWVALVSGHYFQGAMSIDGHPLWHSLPLPGEARSGSEAFAPMGEGIWRMGFGRQGGTFASVDVETGTVIWEHDLSASVTNPISCDIDGDGAIEFIVGDSHGNLSAIGGDEAAVLKWSIALGAAVGNPIAADMDGDGATDLVVPTADGRIHLLTAVGRDSTQVAQ